MEKDDGAFKRFLVRTLTTRECVVLQVGQIVYMEDVAHLMRNRHLMGEHLFEGVLGLNRLSSVDPHVNGVETRLHEQVRALNARVFCNTRLIAGTASDAGQYDPAPVAMARMLPYSAEPACAQTFIETHAYAQ
jgi:hypothetical protein